MATIPAALRSELKVGKLVQMGDLSYVIKEPDKQAFYHFEEAQYQLMSLFDGVRELSQLVEQFNQTSDEYEFDLDAATDLYESCRNFQLLKRTRKENNAALLEKIREDRKKKMLQGQGSLLYLRFQLVDPNAYFDRIIDKIRFLWHPKAIKLQICLVVIAFILVLFQGERFFNDFNRVYLQAHESSFGILSIWLIALGAIAIHECGHGLTCKYYGGDVHEMGFLLLAFQPCLYCNVNDAWLFESKWQKINVALAGVWVEMQLAALSAFVWLLVDVSNPIGFIAFVLLTIGTATSLVVNLNPLLKFDGYYILTDLLEIQNLRQNAMAWLSYSLKTRILRMPVDKPFSPTEREKSIYLIYASLVTVYMIAMLSFIALVGYGFVSAQLGFIANVIFIYLVFLFVKKITGDWGETLKLFFYNLAWRSNRRQQVTGLSAFILLLIIIIWQPSIRIHSTGTVEAPTEIIHAPENGFITYVGFNAQREVINEQQAPFIIMSSSDLDFTHIELASSKNILQIQQQEASANLNVYERQKLAIESTLLQEKIWAANTQNTRLSIHRPRGQWVVDDMPPQAYLGRYYNVGEPILKLVAKQSRFIDVIVDQRDVNLLNVGHVGRIQLPMAETGVYNAKVLSIAPVGRLAGVEQSFVVRMGIDDTPDLAIPRLGLQGKVIILGQPLPVWQHLLHSVRKILRADLWL
ncbi:hypothetical protein [Algibacillus agarilyticus]|uniref:hypothetical protein n=1 Tax=Algibacillus agarilyticus TaxID=2234133 RepID=UPI000DD0E48D|nr:hypothetical protein [Algibacillus agarilyticus]